MDKKRIKALISDIESVGKYDSVTEINKLKSIEERSLKDAQKATEKYKKDGVMVIKSALTLYFLLITSPIKDTTMQIVPPKINLNNYT